MQVSTYTGPYQIATHCKHVTSLRKDLSVVEDFFYCSVWVCKWVYVYMYCMCTYIRNTQLCVLHYVTVHAVFLHWYDC